MTTVLIVDDRPINREIARETLSRGGHEVIEATDGPHALDLARNSHPDAIVVDVLMPGMDGYEFVHELRTAADTASIPVLFYTANYRPDEVAHIAGALQVSKVLSKSADPVELLHAVDEAIHDRPTRVPAATTATFEESHARAVSAKLVETVRALDESDARFLTMAETAPIGIVACDIRGHATYVNQRLSDITQVSLSGLLGRGWLSNLSPTCREEIERYIGGGVFTGDAETLRCQDQITLPEGSSRWVTILLGAISDSEEHLVSGFVGTVDDVTLVVEAERRHRAEQSESEAETRRQMTRRFDGLARVAGAVAHDFNNLLNTIVNCGDFASEAVTSSVGRTLSAEQATTILDDLHRIHEASRRAGQLAHQLLTVGGREAVTPTVVDVNEVTARTVETLGTLAGPRLSITTALRAQASQVLADEDQLRQILLNLGDNARDAMPGGGCLHIATANTDPTDTDPANEAGPTAGLGPGQYVHIAVSDSGEGMSPEVAQHAVEPFFTTKQPGEGAGLGLAIAYGIIKQAGGDLVIDSRPHQGTTVNLYLPTTARQPALTEPATVPATPAGRTLLVAEDDPDVRNVVTRILRRAGYDVITAGDGEAALAAARSHPGVIDMLLTDVVMPRMNGKQLAEKFAAEWPGAPILYMSGYAAPIMTEQGLLEPGVRVIGKPFTGPVLLDAITSVLAAAPTSSSSGAKP